MSERTEHHTASPAGTSAQAAGRLVFIGVGRLGAACVGPLIRSGLKPRLVLTSPLDHLSAPLEQICQRYDIPCSRPGSFNEDDVREQITTIRPDLGVIGGAGEILRERILTIPRLGFLNVHLSLLPHYRGPRPWKWAIARGETQTGITVHQLDKRIDSGPILAQTVIDITPADNADSLFQKLVEQSPGLLLQSIEGFVSGRIYPRAQDSARASYYSGPTLSDARISWDWSTQRIHNLVRGFGPSLGGHCRLDDRDVRIVRTSVCPGTPGAPPGSILSIPRPGESLVATSDGVLLVHELYDSASGRLVTPQLRQRFTATEGKAAQIC
jgi:methionyl-tRNA formyltransferase